VPISESRHFVRQHNLAEFDPELHSRNLAQLAATTIPGIFSPIATGVKVLANTWKW